jgi:hypothetical protein
VRAIERAVVAETQAAVSALPPRRRRLEMERAGSLQPDLQALLFDATGELSAPAQELAGYVYFVIWEAFRTTTNGKVPRIRSAAALRKLEENRQLFARLGPEVFEKADTGEATNQRALFFYVVDMVFGQTAAEPEIEDDEKGTLFLILKTIIDALDEAREGIAWK